MPRAGLPVTRIGAERVLVGGKLVDGDVDVADGLVTAITPPSRGTGRIVAPGFVDLQVNGFGSVDFTSCQVESLLDAAQQMRSTGTTAFLPTLVTAPLDPTVSALGVIRAATESDDPIPRAVIVGAHLEGPFLSPHRLGAHPAEHRRDPDPVHLDRLLAAGPVNRVTLAPELPGADELIAALVTRGIEVAAGHSDATASEAARGFDLGIRSTTHHGNAMRPFHQREPGLFGCALGRGDVTPTVVVDGHHLHADTVRMVFAATAGQVALVTDAVALTDESSGVVAGRPVREKDGAVRDSKGTLAGSSLTMDVAVRNVVTAGIDPVRALAAASCHPRRLSGLPHHDGIRVGASADLVVLDGELGVLDTLLAGR